MSKLDTIILKLKQDKEEFMKSKLKLNAVEVSELINSTRKPPEAYTFPNNDKLVILRSILKKYDDTYIRLAPASVPEAVSSDDMSINICPYPKNGMERADVSTLADMGFYVDKKYIYYYPSEHK